ncbi:MAG TPA: nuclease-related domain-containing protein [Acidimicrobiales bacterium]|nr:nuclease-related domain-containing protein [Acidimicrobiales bacterium]
MTAVSCVAASGPAWLSVSSVAGSVLCGWASISGDRRHADRWRRGADGERATAVVLDALPARRWAVWHDLRVPGSRANIDHVVVGRTGVWVVDTKSTRAEVRAGWRSVRFGDRRLDTGPTVWEADVVRARLERVLGWPVPVRPVIAVHQGGRAEIGLRRRGMRVGPVRVVPATAVGDRLTAGRRRLSRRQIPAVIEAMDDSFMPAVAR